MICGGVQALGYEWSKVGLEVEWGLIAVVFSVQTLEILSY